ncbi:MAG: CHAT domain-containing protein [Chitinophagaceae bacterium]
MQLSIDTFNFKKDPLKFPAYSDWLYKVHETNEGKILAVCSDEGHLKYKGVRLDGGLLEFNEKENKFIRFNIGEKVEQKAMGFNWFITSYTPITKDYAILGTLRGFAEDNKGFISDIDTSVASYREVKKIYPSLFLGTKGANLKDLWLFGSASGVVSYINGIWFYPDRLNQMLPRDIELSRYGSRKVNAVAVTSTGRIYVGTDLGLLKYDIEGGDPMQFLFSNTDMLKTASYMNQQLLRKERNSILAGMDSSSAPGQLFEKFRGLQKDKDEITVQLGKKERMELLSDQPRQNKQDSLLALMKEVKKDETAILLEMAQKYPALYQLQRVDPIDLRSFSGQLQEKEGILQFIPMADRLYVQLIRKNKDPIMKSVNVSLRELIDTIRFVREQLGQGTSLEINEENSLPDPDDKLANTLIYLYSILIRPVEIELQEMDNIYINPAGSLFYVPFGALCYVSPDKKLHYAVEKFNFGYISSMYMLQLIYNTRQNFSQSNLVMADPDETLEGAREEGGKVADLLKTKAYIGKNATKKLFEKESETCRYIHLATHGHLENNRISESWLQFSDSKLRMDEVLTMDFNNTEMIVLSACQSSKGEDGIEYATMARAFNNAHVPTITATLWSVSDGSSTELMTLYYENLSKGMSKFGALAEAQRTMIKSPKRKLSSPSKWAAYIVIGKP